MYKEFFYQCRVVATGLVVPRSMKCTSIQVLLAQMNSWNRFPHYQYFMSEEDKVANLSPKVSPLKWGDCGYFGKYPHSYEFKDA